MEKLPDYDQKIDRLTGALSHFFLQKGVIPIGESFSFLRNASFANLITILMVLEDVPYFWDTFGLDYSNDGIVSMTTFYQIVVDVASATYENSSRLMWCEDAVKLYQLDNDQTEVLKNDLLRCFSSVELWNRVSPSDAE